MRNKDWRRMVGRGVLVLALPLLAFGLTLGSGQERNVNPNGFPSGEHYNLNIIGKNAEFTCSAPELDANGIPLYGNVVFVPENGLNIQILMQSGRKGKTKGGEAITELRVVDPCTAPFDGDAAVIELPANPYGYDVYARALAKPTGNPSMTVTPSLINVEDEVGDTLVWLGIVYSDGLFSQTTETFTRSKGKSTAIPITDLFMWSGLICWDVSCDTCTATSFCRNDSTGELTPKEGDLCPAGSTEVTLYCRTYDIPTWVFNIGDFVTYGWSADNAGLKLVQIRFYPRTQ